MDINRYLNLITSQHRQQPKFIAWLGAPLTIADDYATLINEFLEDFDLETAIGAQLDMLGEVVGVSRTVSFEPSGGVSPKLDDDVYRSVIKAKIAKNQWDGTITGLVEIYKSIFPETVMLIQDYQTMNVTITLLGAGSTLQQELTANGYFVPKAEGVNYTYVFATDVIFAFDIDNAYYSGFDSGYWL